MAASAVAPFVPTQWAKPVVSSLVLPVHAQTSIPESLCSGCLILPGFDITCNDPIQPSNDSVVFVDDTDPNSPVFTNSGSSSADFILIRSEKNLNGIVIAVIGQNVPTYFGTTDTPSPQGCTYTNFTGQQTIAQVLTGAVNGTLYNVSGTVTASSTGVELSDILLMPQ